MKKIFAVTSCLILAVNLLTGCTTASNNSFTEKNHTQDAANIRSIHLDVKDRKIDISISQDDRINIGYFENEKEYYDIELSDGDTLNMTFKDAKEWSDYIGSKAPLNNRTISVQIPKDQLDSLVLSTTNEDILIPDLSLNKTCTVSVNNGNIIFDQLDVGSGITMTAKKGNISGTITGSYDDFAIQAAAKKGKSNLPEQKNTGEKNLILSTNSGNIDIQFEKN